MRVLKQSTAVNISVFMTDSSDHVTGKTGLTLTITASKAAASFASISPTVTELANGWYKLALTTSHTDTAGDFALHITGTGADPSDILCQVTARLWDDLAYPATSGRSMVVDANGLVDANTVKVGPTGSGTAQTARDLGASVLLSSGTGTGQISLSSGAVLLQATQTGVTIPTVTNLTNAPGAGDFTSTMKTSIGTAVAASAVASVTGAVGSVTGNVGGNVTGSVGSLATQAKADVNAEVVDALATDTYAEPGQGTPAATLSLSAKIGYLFKAWRNKSTQTSTAYTLYNDDAATVDQKATTSDDGTTFSRGEVTTGP